MDVKSGKPVFQKNHNEFSRSGRDLMKRPITFDDFYDDIDERMQFDLKENGI